jgi:4-amino-4-deoxy-L-arabinose transferase-like glycosyltransferase
MREFFRARPWTGWAAAFALLYAVNLGSSELSAIDESRTAVIARDMAENGNWLLPRTPDGYLSEKPPLHYPLTAGATRVFGEGEGSLRGVSVLMAIGTLIIVGGVAQAIGTPRTAVLAVGILGSNILFMSWARTAMVDMTLTFFLTAGMAAYLAARLGRLGVWSASALCGASFGLAVLTKGPLGLALPVAAVVLDVLVASRGRFWKAPIPWVAAGLAGLIMVELSLIWYLPGVLAGGREFLNTSLLDENVYMPLGLSHGIAGSHIKPAWYYPVRQLMVLLPAAALLPEAVRRLVRRDAPPPRTLLVTWIAAGSLVLMAASNKRWYYLLPLQPAIAILVSFAISPLWDSAPTRVLRWGSRVMGVLLAAGALIGAAGAFGAPALTGSEDTRRLLELMRQNRGWLALGGAILSFAGVHMLMASFGPTPAMIRAVLVAGVVMAGFRTLMLDPIRGTEDQYRPFAAEMSRQLPPGTAVAVWPPPRVRTRFLLAHAAAARGEAAASSSEYVLVRQFQISELPFPSTPGRSKILVGCEAHGARAPEAPCARLKPLLSN